MAHFLCSYDYGFVLECLKRSLKCTKIVKHRSDLCILFTANDNTPMINLLVVPSEIARCANGRTVRIITLVIIFIVIHLPCFRLIVTVMQKNVILLNLNLHFKPYIFQG